MENEPDQVPQQPNPAYQEQFQKQADIINNRERQFYRYEQDKYERRLEKPTITDRIKLTKPVQPQEKPKTTSIEMAHREALRVNSVVEKAKKNGSRESRQKIAETVLTSKEFGLKTPEELERRERLIHYYPEIVKKVYEADHEGAWKMLQKEIYKKGSPAHIFGDLVEALGELTADHRSTIYKAEDYEAKEKIAAKNIFMNGKMKTKKYSATRRYMSPK